MGDGSLRHNPDHGRDMNKEQPQNIMVLYAMQVRQRFLHEDNALHIRVTPKECVIVPVLGKYNDHRTTRAANDS